MKDVETSGVQGEFNVKIEDAQTKKSLLTLSADTFRSAVNHYLVRPNFRLINEIVNNLLEARNFLGFQLDYALNNLTESQFNQISDEHFSKQNVYTEDELLDFIKQILSVLSIEFTSDDIATMLNCDMNLVQKIVKSISSNPQSLNK